MSLCAKIKRYDMLGQIIDHQLKAKIQPIQLDLPWRSLNLLVTSTVSKIGVRICVWGGEIFIKDILLFYTFQDSFEHVFFCMTLCLIKVFMFISSHALQTSWAWELSHWFYPTLYCNHRPICLYCVLISDRYIYFKSLYKQNKGI